MSIQKIKTNYFENASNSQTATKLKTKMKEENETQHVTMLTTLHKVQRYWI